MKDSSRIALGENLKIEVPIRRVIKWGVLGYGVAEFKNVQANLWVHVGGYFADIKDAYAELGMMSQRVVLKEVPENYMKGHTPVPPKLTVTVTDYTRQPDGTHKEEKREEEII